jgi:hypothetical protein
MEPARKVTTRFVCGEDRPKQFRLLGDQTLLAHTIRRAESSFAATCRKLFKDGFQVTGPENARMRIVFVIFAAI